MKAYRTPLEASAGRLISAVQREWHAEAGERSSADSEEVMHSCHVLLQASKRGCLSVTLGQKNVAQFLGAHWVAAHPNVAAAITEFEAVAQGKADF